MHDISLRYLLAAWLVAVVSAIPFLGMEDWTTKDTEFDRQVSAEDLGQGLMNPSSDNAFTSLSDDLDRIPSSDQVQPFDYNGLVPTHRGKRFGFGLLPMGFTYRLPIFPRRTRRINSRNYVAMRGKRLRQLDYSDMDSLDSFGHKEGTEITKRRGFTALRGR